MLKLAGIRSVEPQEAFAALGYREAGLLIPYRDVSGTPVQIDGKAFARLRLNQPKGSAKYLSPKGSGCQLYVPPGLRKLLLPGCVLGIVEGEFKCMALAEAGFPCVGIGGITSACPKDSRGEPELLPMLDQLIAEVRPARLAFIGDSDTALIPDFAREALKLAGLVRLPVVLPRIPLDAPGKGPDDLRQIWGVEFAVRWQRILDDAEPVDPESKPAALALRLLRRELDPLRRLRGSDQERARDRLVKLAARFTDSPLESAELEEIAKDSLQIRVAVFRTARGAAAAEAKREAAERLRHKALSDLGAKGGHPLFFDGNHYWRREADGAFGQIKREDVRLHLNKVEDLSKFGDPSPCDAALHDLQVNNRVDFAGPLCGRPAGLHKENGVRVLATKGPDWIEGKPGEAPTITRLIANLLGREAGDPHAARQAQLFIGWLKLAREAVRNPGRHLPGQVLALIGPANCGKSLLQSLVITPSLGGRSADPGLFLTGQTPFNADLWGAEHLAIGDKALDVEGKQRSTLRNELKRAVAESICPLHPKGRDARNFRPIWRITLSANCDPESASNLPALDASFEDKIIYLRCYAPPEPFHDSGQPGARERFADAIRKELPAFLAEVDAFEIPAELRKARFGICEWHHPAVLELLEDADPLRPIGDCLESWIETWEPDCWEQTHPTGDLYRLLDENSERSLSRLKVSSGPKHLGHQLAKLATQPDWQDRLIRTSRRRGGRERNAKQACWQIFRTDPR